MTDLRIDLPDLTVDLGDVNHPFMDELRRVAPTSPTGQKRVLSITDTMVYRLRVSSERGATWVNTGGTIVWLCAAHRRESGSDDDAYNYFAGLHAAGGLLPMKEDELRDRAESAIRLFRGCEADLFGVLDDAMADLGTEHHVDLGGWIPCRVVVLPGDGLQEIWCAVSVRTNDDKPVDEELRDLLFASLEAHLSPAIFEARHDWPWGDVEWFEVVRLGIR